MTSLWFPGGGRTEDDEAFLAALRAAADEHGLIDATPAGTGLHPWGHALAVLVPLPGLQRTKAAPTLEVIASLQSGSGLLCGVETYGHEADSCGDMDLGDVERTPGALGRRAFDWLSGQLRRPVERATWRTWRGERSAVRFADDGELICSDLLRRPRRPPDRVDPLRPHRT